MLHHSHIWSLIQLLNDQSSVSLVANGCDEATKTYMCTYTITFNEENKY